MESTKKNGKSFGHPVTYLYEGPNVIDQRPSKENINDDQHDKAEDIQSQAAKLVILNKRHCYVNFDRFLPSSPEEVPQLPGEFS